MSRSEIKREALNKLGNSVFSETWIRLVFIQLMVYVLTNVINIFLYRISSQSASFTINIIRWLILIPIEFSITRLFMNVIRYKSSVEVKEVYYYYNNPVMGIYSLSALKSMFLGLWACIPFAVIVKAYSYALAEYIKINKPDLSANDCITESRIKMHGHKFELFCLDFSFIGWFLLSLITFNLITPHVTTYYNMSRILFFEKVCNFNNVASVNETYENENRTSYKADFLDILVTFLLWVLFIALNLYLMLQMKDIFLQNPIFKKGIEYFDDVQSNAIKIFDL